MIRPDLKEFSRLARKATLVPVVKSISADLLTPVSAFLAIAEDEPDAFLLESVEGGEKIGRYTFLGVRPFLRLESRGSQIKIERGRKVEQRPGDIFQVMKELLRAHPPAAIEGLPPFTAGAAGACADYLVRGLARGGLQSNERLLFPHRVVLLLLLRREFALFRH